MKNVILNTILAAGCACLIALIQIPLAAEIRLLSAEDLIAKYRWKAAEARLEETIRINPFDARYPARLGEFLLMQSEYTDNKLPLYQRAEKYFKRASAIDRGNAAYPLRLGQIYFLMSDGARQYIDKALGFFKRAEADEPKGFNVPYAWGYYGLTVWRSLNEQERTDVIGQMKRALKLRPWCAEFAYTQILSRTKDPALIDMVTPEGAAAQSIDLKKIAEIKKAAANGAASAWWWQGTASDGLRQYDNGNMYWTGTAYRAINIMSDNAVIRITMKGSCAGGVYPYAFIFLDGKRAGGVYVESLVFKEYDISAGKEKGIMVLGVTFTNDGIAGNEDRNLVVGEVRVEER